MTWRSCTGFYVTTRVQPSTAYHPRTPWPDTRYLNTSRTGANLRFPAHNTFRAPQNCRPSTDQNIQMFDMQDPVLSTHLSPKARRFTKRQKEVLVVGTIHPAYIVGEYIVTKKSTTTYMNLVQSHIIEIDDPL